MKYPPTHAKELHTAEHKHTRPKTKTDKIKLRNYKKKKKKIYKLQRSNRESGPRWFRRAASLAPPSGDRISGHPRLVSLASLCLPLPPGSPLILVANGSCMQLPHRRRCTRSYLPVRFRLFLPLFPQFTVAREEKPRGSV